MFATHETFKFPLQVDDDYTLWRGVELMLKSAWLLATVEDRFLAHRTFLLLGTDDLLSFVKGSELGKLTSVRLVFPPKASLSGDWVFEAVYRIEQQALHDDRFGPNAQLVLRDGRRYGGFPIGRTYPIAESLELLLELPIASSLRT